jgi:hypothetical protein
MARLGTIFVELDLDRKKFSAAEQDVLAKSMGTTVELEKNWRNLGTKSAGYYDALRASVEKSHAAIRASAMTTHADLIRAQEAATAKIKSINEQQYGHQTSLLSKMKANWIAASVAIYAAMSAAQKAWGLAEVAASYAEQRGILDNLSRKYKTTAEEIVKSMRFASEGMIANADLMRIAVGGLAKGLNPDQLIKLADAAKLLSDTVGTDAKTALDALTQSLETGRVRGLKAYGGTVIDLRKAFGELETQLTEAEKAQAMYAMIMIHATKLQKEQTGVVDQTADKMERMTASYNNATLAVGNFFKTIIGGIYDFFTVAPEGLGSVFDLTGQRDGKAETPKTAADRAIAEYERQLAALKKLLESRKDATSSIKNMSKEAERLAEAWKGAMTSMDTDLQKVGLDDFERKLVDITRKAEELKLKFAGIQGAGDKIAAWEATMGDEAAIEAGKKDFDDYLKQLEQQQRIEKEVARNAEEARKLAIQAIKERGEAARDLYKDLAGYEITYRNELFALIDEQAARYKALGLDQVAIAKWVADEKRKLDQKVAEDQIRNIQSALDAAMTMYDEESSEYKRLSEWKKAVRIAELAMEAAKNVQIIAGNISVASSAASASVANAGQAVTGAAIGVGPTGFATAAAMIALMASVFAMYGIAKGGSVPTAAAVAPKVTMSGRRSTVLGAEYDFESESISNSLKMMDDTLGDMYQLEYRELRGIHSAVKQLNTNITGLVRTLVSGGDPYSTGGMFAPFTEYNVNQSTLNHLDTLGKIFGTALPLMKFLDPVSGFSTLASKLYQDMFGGKVTVEATGGGISYTPPTVGGLAEGEDVSGQSYAWRQMKKSGGWFSSSKRWTEYAYAALDADTTRMLTQVYKHMSDTLIYLTEGLGGDMAKTLAYQFSAASFELAGLTGEQVTAKLQAYFSQQADLAVNTLFGDLLKKYQQLNEGLYETAIRVLMNKEVIAETLKMTNQSFTGTIPAIIAFSESVIKMAGGLDKFTEAASYYYEGFFSEEERMMRTKGQMEELFEDLNLSMPRTRSAYRDLIESFDLMTESGKENYVTLIMMAEATDQYYDMLDKFVDKLKSARESMRLQGLEYEMQRSVSARLAFQTILDQARMGNFAGLSDIDKSLSEITSSASSTRQFATRQEYEANFYKTFNSIAELEGLVGGQIPIQERQLIVLEQIAENTGQAAPGFASGGSFSGGWRVVGERGPELEYTGASRIFSNRESKSLIDNSAVVNAINLLRSEIQAGQYAIAKSSNKTAKIVERWDVDGQPEVRTLT